MAREYSLVPARPACRDAFSPDRDAVPIPESIPVLETLNRYEPVAMRGQPPVVWDHAEGFQVYDRWGNKLAAVMFFEPEHRATV
jgi:4-aminobutyrate aminotransferase / (S)-3-amino-2-methylpropionate transaminase / 5-aminovalerate transaminase